jgi:predicted metalloendopeptidase
MDRSIKPGGDFYHYANGGWLRTATISAGQASYDTRAILVARTSQRVRDLIQEAAAAQSAKGSVAQKVGDYYASFMDESSIGAKGMTPLADEMAMISAITNKASLSAYLGATLNTEVDGLTGNADHIFGAWVNQSFTDSQHYVFHLLQGGLGMPDRDDYLDQSSRMAALRLQYQAHIAAMLKLAGVSDAGSRAAPILTLEIRIAQAHAPDAVTETFSAGLLQPAYFDSQGDAASNYGSAGAGIAHEISHSLDELGNIYDAQGRLGNWWTTEDLAKYQAEAAKLVAQFSGYCPLSDLCVNGKQILTENIADLAGLLTAHDAYVLSLKGKTDVVISGLTGEHYSSWRSPRGGGKLRAKRRFTGRSKPTLIRRGNIEAIQCAMSRRGTRPTTSCPATGCM